MSFAENLLHWYDEHARELPWRGIEDPYKIWISEIILQQTRIIQGWNYYLNFIKTFPNVQVLAAAPLEKVLKVWQGLGYYSRARNIHFSAQIIVNQYNGVFPEKFHEILKLKGVGTYTAAAIASIAFNEAVAVVDGNVLRVSCRYFGIFDDINSATSRKTIFQRLSVMIPDGQAARFNQAMMDFGALQCVPQKPDCIHCPLTNNCYASSHQKVGQLPINNQKITIKKRFFHYFIVNQENTIILQQRTAKDIWQGLYEFPLIETETEQDEKINKILQKYHHPQESDHIVKHQLTHQLLKVYFYYISTNQWDSLTDRELQIATRMLTSYPFPKIIAEMIDSRYI